MSELVITIALAPPWKVQSPVKVKAPDAVSVASDLKKLPLSIESKVVALTLVKEEPLPLYAPLTVKLPQSSVI